MGAVSFLREVKAAPAGIRRYIGERFASWLATHRFIEALPGHLGYDGVGRLTSVIVGLHRLANIDLEATPLPMDVPEQSGLRFQVDRGRFSVTPVRGATGDEERFSVVGRNIDYRPILAERIQGDSLSRSRRRDRALSAR
jgi:hypothetical protein